MEQVKSQYSVLFIEDEKAIRDNYVNYLRKYFVNVYEAADGESAYEIYKSKRPELLIVDINIPKLNGLDLLKKIRQTDRETRAIVLTAHTDVKYLLEAAELNLTKYLVKPIARQELKEALSQALEDLKSFTVRANKIIYFKDSYTFNCETKELYHIDRLITLTKIELDIFLLLIKNNKIKVTSSDECIWYIWGEDSYSKNDSLKTLIKNLRKKLPPNTIENVFGIGYKLCI